MDREQVIVKAKNWIETNTSMRWTTEAVGVEKLYSLDELNARCDRRAEQLADFALEVLTERDAEIADDIIQLHQNHKTNELFLRELSYFVHELKGGNATAHAMFDEIREAELESLRRTTCPECGCGI